MTNEPRYFTRKMILHGYRISEGDAIDMLDQIDAQESEIAYLKKRCEWLETQVGRTCFNCAKCDWRQNQARHYCTDDNKTIHDYDEGCRNWVLREMAKEEGMKMKNGIIENADGTRMWYLNDKLHRVDGPAVERANGDRVWYLEGQRHRVDGPAVEWADGYREWYLNGKLQPEKKGK